MFVRRLIPAALASLLVGCGDAVVAPGNGPPVTPPPTDTPAAAAAFVKGSITDGGITYPYQLFTPKGFTTSRKWPVIIALAGSGERGSDNEAQMKVGLANVVRAQAETFPAVVFFPQVPTGDAAGSGFAHAATLLAQRAEQQYAGDASRIYLTGLSQGGIIGYTTAYRYPTLFAAFVPVAAMISPSGATGNSSATAAEANALVAQALKALPIWAFHGTYDTTVPTASDRAVAAAFQAVGANFRYTEYPTGHNVWDTVYATPALYDWLFAQHR